MARAAACLARARFTDARSAEARSAGAYLGLIGLIGLVCAISCGTSMALDSPRMNDSDAGAGSPAGNPVLEPFSAHYLADWKTINVGTSDLELKPDPQSGGYLYTWTVSARGIFRLIYSDDVVQKSSLAIVGDHVRPLEYRAVEGASSVRIDFDWKDLRAQGTTEKKPVDVKLSEGTQDVMSIQVEVMLDLKNGHLPAKFSILDRDEIKEFSYTDEGSARLRTALGELDTRVVSSHRTGSDRILRMWFAPALGFVPVQAERFHSGKLEFAMRIKTLKR